MNNEIVEYYHDLVEDGYSDIDIQDTFNDDADYIKEMAETFEKSLILQVLNTKRKKYLLLGSMKMIINIEGHTKRKKIINHHI